MLSVSTGHVADPLMCAPYTKAVVNALYAVLDNAQESIYRLIIVRDNLSKLVLRFLAVVAGLKGHAAEQLTAGACLARVCSLEPASSCNTKPNHYRVTALKEGMFNHIFLAIRDALDVSILPGPVELLYLARILHDLVTLATL